MDFYHSSTGNDIPIIDDTPEGRAYAMPSKIDGSAVGYAYVPRDYSVYPKEMFDPPSGMPLIPESEMDARWEEQEALKSSLEHVYLGGPGGTPIFTNLDQNGDGHCWAYSTGQAIMLVRASMHQPLVRLNPHSIAVCLRQLQGGWCGLSARFALANGLAEEGTGPGQWPLHSNSASNDTPACRALMAQYKVTEDWIDLTRDVYDQNLSDQMSKTCSFINVPHPSDFNHWSHSVCTVRWVRIEPGSWGRLILNSWKGWGRHGLGVLRGDKARSDGAVAFRAAIAA